MRKNLKELRARERGSSPLDLLEANGIRFRPLTEFRRPEGSSNDVEASPERMSGISSTTTWRLDEDGDDGVRGGAQGRQR